MKKDFILGAVCVLILFGLSFYLYDKQNKPIESKLNGADTSLEQTYFLGGSLREVRIDTIGIKAIVFRKDKQDLQEIDRVDNLNLIVPESVIITRTILLVPEGVTEFNAEKLESEVKVVSFAELQNDFKLEGQVFGIGVDATKDIGGQFVASTISYRYLRFTNSISSNKL